jgi:hypothetical protein
MAMNDLKGERTQHLYAHAAVWDTRASSSLFQRHKPNTSWQIQPQSHIGFAAVNNFTALLTTNLGAHSSAPLCCLPVKADFQLNLLKPS